MPSVRFACHWRESLVIPAKAGIQHKIPSAAEPALSVAERAVSAFLGPHHPGKGLDFAGKIHNNPRFDAGSREFAHVAATEPQAKWMAHTATGRAFSIWTGQLLARIRYEDTHK